MIALLTDFGIEDIYIGVMKGVIHGLHPGAHTVDLTHGIEPQNVRQAAFALLNAYRYFPKGTVFLVVVDPGVGSTRRPIAVKAGDYYFVAPDNGVLSYALAELGETSEAIEIQVSDDGVSKTFHGRDVFAPTAARLLKGDALTSLGTSITHLFTLPQPPLYIDGKQVIGEIVHIDRFGNLITNIGKLRWIGGERLTLSPSFGHHEAALHVFAETSVITVNDHTILGIRHTYSEAERGGLLSLIGSSAYLEISMNQGNAQKRLDVMIGDRVELTIGEFDATVLD
ncbi:MAG: SAM-dependent chlorinase/fluorinase [Anaerolineae bacterium]|jgi:hypothetical protein|nr:SAM-dependent chlorinase/fluorinase [Anaerolineae bacterium]